MVDPTTSNLGLAVPTHGSDVDTWDQPVNNNASIIDSKFGVVSSIALSNVNVTLTPAQYQCGVLRFSGTLTANVTVTLPAVSLIYIVENRCTGSFYVALRTAGAGEVIGCPPGNAFDIYTDGANVRYRNLAQTGKMEWWYTGALPGWATVCSVQPWFIMDGTTFSAGSYPALNSFLGGNTLPDFRGRSPFMLDGGTNRLSSATMTPNGNTLGATNVAAAETVTLSLGQIPSITPTFNGNVVNLNAGTQYLMANNTWSAPSGGGSFTTYYATQISSPSYTFTPTGSITAFGGGLAHNNVPPALVGGIFIIKT